MLSKEDIEHVVSLAEKVYGAATDAREHVPLSEVIALTRRKT